MRILPANSNFQSALFTSAKETHVLFLLVVPTERAFSLPGTPTIVGMKDGIVQDVCRGIVSTSGKQAEFSNRYHRVPSLR